MTHNLAEEQRRQMVRRSALRRLGSGTGLGRLEQAAAEYRRAIELDQNHAEAHVNLGFTLRNLGKYMPVRSFFVGPS